MLAAPSLALPFKLTVDTSDAGAGAVLLQDRPDGVEHPASCDLLTCLFLSSAD